MAPPGEIDLADSDISNSSGSCARNSAVEAGAPMLSFAGAEDVTGFILKFEAKRKRLNDEEKASQLLVCLEERPSSASEDGM